MSKEAQKPLSKKQILEAEFLKDTDKPEIMFTDRGCKVIYAAMDNYATQQVSIALAEKGEEIKALMYSNSMMYELGKELCKEENLKEYFTKAKEITERAKNMILTKQP